MKRGDTNALAFWNRKDAVGWDAYWDTLGAPHRDALIDALRKLPPFRSLLEVGCGPGVNLFRVLQAFPDVDVTGVDVSQAAIDNGDSRFRRAIEAGELPGAGRAALCSGELPEALDVLDSVDVVLSCYSLAYVHPVDIRRTIEKLLELADQAIVIAEPMLVPGLPSGLIPNLTARPRPKEFRYDYLRWFQERERDAWSVTVMKPLIVDRMNRLLVAERVRPYGGGLSQ
jgi:SAM-dependent methyltransferase